MKLLNNIDVHIAAFEQQRGGMLKSQVVDLINDLAVAGDQFEKLGMKDAAAGRPQQRGIEDFIKWGKRELDDPEGKDNSIVQLMYMCYLDGYKAGKAAV